jgi:hypothetical protein
VARMKLLLALGLALAARAQAWDLGADYGTETVTLGEYYTGGSGGKVNTPAFDLSIPLTRYSLTDYSGELAAGITNATRMAAANEGAKQDAIRDAENKAARGEYGDGHGSRTWELAQPVEGRTVISYATGKATGGTYQYASGSTGAVVEAKALEVDYLRNAGSGEWDSFYGTAYAVDVTLAYKSYDMTYSYANTSYTTALRTDNRSMLGIPVGLTLAHGLGVENLQAQVYADFDVLMGITYFAKWNGLSYGYGTRVNYKLFNCLSLFGGYDVRAYVKSSVTDNTDGSKRIEGPTQMAAWKAGASVDLGYLFELLFTEID